MATLSLCLPVGDYNYRFLDDQNWAGVELIAIGNKAGLSKFWSQIQNHAQKIPDLKLVQESDHTSLLKTAVNKASGKFIAIVNPTEFWQPNFVAECVTFVKKEDNSTRKPKALFGYGFVQSKLNKTFFCSDFIPALKAKNEMLRNLVHPTFFSPCIKYFWEKEIIEENKLSCPQHPNLIMQKVLMDLEYLSTLFYLNQNEPAYSSCVLSFRVDEQVNLISPENLNIYREKIVDKKDLWEKDPWSKLFWLSKIANTNRQKSEETLNFSA